VSRRLFGVPASRSGRTGRRAVLVGVTAVAVVLGWAAPVSAAAPGVPLGLATEDVESQSPVLAATVSDPDGGSVTGQFYARSPGSATWNIVNAGSVAVASGQRARYRLGAQRIGSSFEWMVRASWGLSDRRCNWL
jgi:hypothetical protein